MRISSDSIVVITGASKGIGYATALLLAQYKCHLVLVARSKDLLDDLAQKIVHAGAQATVIAADLSKKNSASRIVHCIETQFKRIDILINNAGHGYYAKVEDIDDLSLEKTFRTNLLAPLWLCQKLIPLFKKQKFGHIVNISSVIAYRSLPSISAYCMSKAALNALDESLALELHEYNIDVSLICPGLTQTQFQKNSINAHLNPGLAAKMGASSHSVAKAIVKAITQRKRRMILSKAGKTLVWLQKLFPSSLDAILLRYYRQKNKTSNKQHTLRHIQKEQS